MKRDTVTIMAATVSFDAERTGSTTFSEISTAQGHFLPFSGEMAQRAYGVAINAQYRFLTRQHPAGLVVGSRIRTADGNIYEVVYIGDYVKAVDVMLKTVVDGA